MASLLSKIKAAGFEVSKQKTILWSAPELIEEGMKAEAFESLRVSDKYENSIYAVYREDDESKLISFAKDQLSIDDLEFDDKGIITSGLDGLTFAVGIVTAIRDDEELGINKGERMLKVYVE